jgi:ATP synthase protein I
MALLKNTTWFDFKAFAFTLLGVTIVWIAAQARAYMKAKILYVEPDSSTDGKSEKSGHSS